MRVVFDTLDISQWKGKKQRLQTAIEKEIYQRHIDNTLPFKLMMTMDQYELLKNTIEFGEKGEHLYYQPHQRIYCSKRNCMEIIIK